MWFLNLHDQKIEEQIVISEKRIGNPIFFMEAIQFIIVKSLISCGRANQGQS